jgi:deoxyribonuclease-4
MAAKKKGATKKVATKKPAPKKPAPKKPTVKKSPAKKAAAVAPIAKKPAPKKPSRPTGPTPPPLGDVDWSLPIGAHVSSAGGSPTTPPRSDDIGGSVFQLFTKTANQWKEREIDADEAAAFRAAIAASHARFTVSHDSYLINLASPDPVLRARSIESFTTEMRRAHALGLNGVVSHPGNFMDDHDAGLARNADGITQALRAAPGTPKLFLETTAGSGTALGRSFEELADIIARIPSELRGRLGVCLDTCHVFAAGYDLVSDYDGVWAAFERALGFDRLGVMHLNDSQGALGSRKDRHALIGEGLLGDEPFRRIMRDPRLRHVPKILETPKGDDMVTNDRRMLDKLRAFAAA